MYCPKCKGEFLEGFDFCKKCGVDLVEELPLSEADVMKEQILKII